MPKVTMEERLKIARELFPNRVGTVAQPGIQNPLSHQLRYMVVIGVDVSRDATICLELHPDGGTQIVCVDAIDWWHDPSCSDGIPMDSLLISKMIGTDTTETFKDAVEQKS